MADYSLLSKLLPEAEAEGKTVYNKAALEALQNDKSAQAELAAQLAAGSDQPLTSQPFKQGLAGIDISKLPSQANADAQPLSINLDKSAADLGDSIPASSKASPLDANQDVTGSVDKSSPDALSSKWQQLKDAAPYAGAVAAGTAAGLMSGNGAPPAQAAKAPTPPAAPSDDNDEKLLSDVENDFEPSSVKAKVATSSKTAAPSDKSAPEPSDGVSSYIPADNLASIDKLKALQDRANQAALINTMARGATNTAYAMSGKANPFEKQFESQIAQAGNIPAQYEQLVEFQKQDPKSAISQTYRSMADQLGIPVHPGTSADEIAKAFPQIVNIKTREDMIEARKEIAQDRMQEMHFRNQMLMLGKENQKSQKEQTAFDNTVKVLEQMRGSPAVSQAEKDIYAADKAKEIQNLAPGGDLNKLNPQMVNTLVTEIGKIASGQGSTQAELQSLTPSTLRTKFASEWQQLSNHPSPANAGAFLQQYMKYADGIKSQAHKVISDRYGRIINTVGSHLSPDHNALLQENYINRFTNPLPGTPQYQAPAQVPSAPSASAAPQAGGMQLPSQDDIAAEIARRKAAKGNQ